MAILKAISLTAILAFTALGALGMVYRTPEFIFNLCIYLLMLGANSVWGVTISILATAVGQRLNINYLVARSFYYSCSPLLGITFEVEGEEHLQALTEGHPQSAVLVGNHQSSLDILYLGRIFPKRAAIMAKQELKWAPLLGQYMSLSGAVFVNRKNRKDAVKMMQKAGEDMRQSGVSLWVFPEGTRSSKAEHSLLPFKKGAFHLAVQAQVPIIPVVCENYHRLFDGRTRLNRGVLKIKVLPPISTKGLTSDDVSKLTEETRDLMLKTLKEISAPGEASKPIQEAAPVVELVTAATAQVTEEKRPKAGSDSAEDEMDDDAVVIKRP